MPKAMHGSNKQKAKEKKKGLLKEKGDHNNPRRRKSLLKQRGSY